MPIILEDLTVDFGHADRAAPGGEVTVEDAEGTPISEIRLEGP